MMTVKSESEVTPSCPTLSDPMDCSPPGYPNENSILVALKTDIDQQNRIENPEINTNICNQLIFDKVSGNTYVKGYSLC